MPVRGTTSRVLFGLILVVSSVSGAVTVASAAQTDVNISSVNASVDQPAPGEAFTLAVDVANLESSSGAVDVTDVYVRGSGTDEYARVEDAGSIPSGGSLSIPLTVEIDEPGEKQLTVTAIVKDQDGNNHQVNYPLYVDVSEPDEAAVSVSDVDPVAGQESTVNVTVSNGDSAALSNVRLDLGGNATVEDPERVTASLEPGTQTTHSFDVMFPEAGEGALTATLTYKTEEGSTRTIQRTVTTDVDEADVDTELAAEVGSTNGSVRATLSQYGNVELRDVQVRAIADGDVVARAMMSNVPSEGAATVTFDESDVPAGDVTITAEYTAAGERHTANDTVTVGVDAELTAETTQANGTPAIGVSLSQNGNVALRDVQVRAVVEDETVTQATMETVRQHGIQSVTLDGSAVPAGEVTLIAEYTAAGERQTDSTTMTFSPQESAAMTLTGVEVTREGSTITLDGDAANLGSSDASSVVVSVVDDEGVTPVSPNKDYFVGGVEASEYATFELTANASMGVETVPVRINYSADGQRYSEVVEVDVSDASAAAPAEGQSGNAGSAPSGGPPGDGGGGGGLPLPLIGGAVALLTVVGAAYRWRHA